MKLLLDYLIQNTKRNTNIALLYRVLQADMSIFLEKKFNFQITDIDLRS